MWDPRAALSWTIIMHELSIAMSILDVVEAEAVRQGEAKVVAVHLKLGPLAGVVKEALLVSFETACQGTSLAGCGLVIEEMPIVIDCPTCGEKRSVISMQEMRCSTCGRPADRVVGGRELEVSAIVIVE